MRKLFIINACFLFLFCNKPATNEIKLSPCSWTDTKSLKLKGSVKSLIEFSRSSHQEEIIANLDSSKPNYYRLKSYSDTSFGNYKFKKNGLLSEFHISKNQSILVPTIYGHLVSNGLVIKSFKVKHESLDTCDYTIIKYNLDSLVESEIIYLCDHGSEINKALLTNTRFFYKKDRIIKEIQNSTENWQTIVNYEYDSLGNLCKQHWTGSNPSERTINKQGDLATYTTIINEKENVSRYFYQYDQIGNWLVKTNEDSSYTTYRYFQYY